MTTSMPFAFVDVFASGPLEGNPIALIPDADLIDEPRMRAIAREFNQSETTFIVRPTRDGADCRLRSFTPTGVEVFGAGHNALGAWLWLAQTGRVGTGRHIQEIGTELLPVEVSGEGEATLVTMDQSSATFGAILDDRDALVDALGLDAAQLGDGAAQVVSTGVGHLLVPARDRAAVDAATPDARGLSVLLRTVTDEGCYLYSVDPVDPAAIAYTRFFNPSVGIAEDPATGTAAGPLAARLVAEGRARVDSPLVIEQGWTLGRPSRIRVTVSETAVRISGSGIISVEGAIRI